MALFSAASFRILGSAATPHTLFTLENTAGSSKTVYVRRRLETLNDGIAKAAATVTDREAELAAMEAKIAAAKEQIAKMLGA